MLGRSLAGGCSGYFVYLDVGNWVLCGHLELILTFVIFCFVSLDEIFNKLSNYLKTILAFLFC